MNPNLTCQWSIEAVQATYAYLVWISAAAVRWIVAGNTENHLHRGRRARPPKYNSGGVTFATLEPSDAKRARIICKWYYNPIP